MRRQACAMVLLLAAGMAGHVAGQATPAGKQPPEEPVSNRWALLIGVDEYAEAEKLHYCGADMRALREQLVAAGFPAKQVFLLHDRTRDSKYRPLKANIERQLDLVLGLAEREDLILVAFSGHGVHRNGKSYLCPVETRLDDPQTMIPLDEVYDRLRQCPAALKLALVDACRNDPRRGGEKGLKPIEGTERFARALEQPPEGILLLTSCAPGQISMEDPDFGHGVFMHFVLEGLRGRADGDRNGRVSLLELAKYTNRETKAYVARKFNGYQTPALKGDLADDFDVTTLGINTRVAARIAEARRHISQKQWDQALAALAEAFQWDPRCAEAYRYRGLVYGASA